MDLHLSETYLLFPVKNDTQPADFCRVSVAVSGTVVREFDIALSETPAWFAHLDVREWAGETATIEAVGVELKPAIQRLITPSSALWQEESIYSEPLRPQLHFSSRRGWLNDPNGLVYADGEYHLFYQHNPYGWGWGNMHWGHAVSADLVHWRELPIVLYPPRYGDMAFSGGAVLDNDNTSGWRAGDGSLIVGSFTSTARGECMIYSNDGGRSFTEYDANPVIRHAGRDPRPLWYAAGGTWVMALYDEEGGERKITFHSSPNLKEWTYHSSIPGFYECPDLFELPCGDKSYWVLTGASSDYMVGHFDGKVFEPLTPMLKGHLGKGFYAAQTYTNDPKGRVVQIGWFQADSPGMPFNQAMSLPLTLSLCETADGPRLAWTPVDELAVLRDGSDQSAELASFASELVELRAEFGAVDVAFTVRGATISYEAATQELVVNGHRAPAPLVEGKQRITVYVDRTTLEVFASNGLTFVPMPYIAPAGDRSVSVSGGPVDDLQVYRLRSCWAELGCPSVTR
ncbi:MAG TPA: glycoside hydrolase family 32 protein [Capsulimonadaceae bacterium]|jgi:fructan beta-fructosidase